MWDKGISIGCVVESLWTRHMKSYCETHVEGIWTNPVENVFRMSIGQWNIISREQHLFSSVFLKDVLSFSCQMSTERYFFIHFVRFRAINDEWFYIVHATYD